MKILNAINIIGLSLSIGLIACSSTKPVPPAPGSINYQVEQLGEMKYLQVIDIKATKRNHLLVVQAELNNNDNKNRQLFYRFKWLDQSGFVVGGDEPWKPLALYGLQRQTIDAIAPSPQVTDFRLVVQTPENSGELPNQ